jgi:hypothetical protein
MPRDRLRVRGYRALVCGRSQTETISARPTDQAGRGEPQLSDLQQDRGLLLRVCGVCVPPARSARRWRQFTMVRVVPGAAMSGNRRDVLSLDVSGKSCKARRRRRSGSALAGSDVSLG